MSYQIRLGTALAVILANLLVFSALAANNFLAPEPTPTPTPHATFTPNPAFVRKYISPTPTFTPTATATPRPAGQIAPGELPDPKGAHGVPP